MLSIISGFMKTGTTYVYIVVAIFVLGLLGYNKMLYTEVEMLNAKIETLKAEKKTLSDAYDSQKEAADKCSDNTRALKEAEDKIHELMVEKVENAKVRSNKHRQLATDTVNARPKPVVIPKVPEGTSDEVKDSLKDYLESQDVINSYIDAKTLLEQGEPNGGI